MDRMINEPLELSRKGVDVSDLEQVSLANAVQRARTTAAADLDVTVVGDTRLRADPERLIALLENLLRNADEHAGPSPTVRIGPLADGDGFYVADDGPGILPDERSDVLEHGYTTADGGTGIGLSIARRIADAYGWTMDLAESDGGGARFEFRS
jgi:signal transduction histidine kinase